MCIVFYYQLFCNIQKLDLLTFSYSLISETKRSALNGLSNLLQNVSEYKQYDIGLRRICYIPDLKKQSSCLTITVKSNDV